jgi:hypothetical protein
MRPIRCVRTSRQVCGTPRRRVVVAGSRGCDSRGHAPLLRAVARGKFNIPDADIDGLVHDVFASEERVVALATTAVVPGSVADAANQVGPAVPHAMIARCREERALRKHGKSPMQGKTAVSWHVQPTSEAKSVLQEHFFVMKEQNLLLVSCKTTVFERNRTHGEHIWLQMERKGAFRQGFPPPAEAIFVSLLPKLLYRLHGRHA